MGMHSLEIPRHLHGKAKAIAADKGITLDALLTGLIEDYSTGTPQPTDVPQPRDFVRVKLGVGDADWGAGTARAKAERTTLTAAVLGQIEEQTIR